MGGLPRLFKYLPTADPPVWPSQPCSWNKPVGWWLSVEDAWERWSYASDFRVERVRWRRPVTFTPDARVTMFSAGTVEHAAFSDRYCVTPDWAEELGWSHVADPEWDRVAADMDVLILSPWDRPRGSRPYRWDANWDVPSGGCAHPGCGTVRTCRTPSRARRCHRRTVGQRRSGMKQGCALLLDIAWRQPSRRPVGGESK